MFGMGLIIADMGPWNNAAKGISHFSEAEEFCRLPFGILLFLGLLLLRTASNGIWRAAFIGRFAQRFQTVEWIFAEGEPLGQAHPLPCK
jgi:hypothetical protein